MTHDLAVALVALGTAVIVASSVGALLVGNDVYTRLHFITPTTSLGAPLIAIGLSVDNGWGLTTASILFPVGLLFFAGPVLTAATGRVAAQNEGRIEAGSPE